MLVISCIKQVPDTTQVKIDPVTNTLVREGIPFIVNPYDTHALEESLRLKDRFGFRVAAMSMGPPNAEATLRKALALGVDRALLLSDRVFGGADTLATSNVLAAAIRRLGAEEEVGVVFCGFAGRWKERDQAQSGGAPPSSRKLLIGLALCTLAGVLSAVYGISLTEGAPIAKLAEQHAVGHTVLGIDAATFCSNAIYPFSNSGAFLTTALYCLFLHARHRTLGEIIALPEGEEKASLPVNWAMAILTGCLWYGQFFFYGFGHFYIMKVAGFEQTCWAIHMILLILLGTLIGVVFKEWKGCRPRTYAALVLALGFLIIGKLLLDYGNYLGTQPPQ